MKISPEDDNNTISPEQGRAGPSDANSVASALPVDGSMNSTTESDGLLVSNEALEQMIDEIVSSLSRNLSSEIVDEASEIVIDENNDHRVAMDAKVCKTSG